MRNQVRKPSPRSSEAIVTQTRAAGLMLPLDYMLRVINDSEADFSRRDRLAIAAAQYCHQRMADTRVPKRVRQAEAAQSAGGVGTEWDDDLDVGRPQ